VRFLNGGPGCSSVGGGGFEENGPFIPDADGNLQYNNYTWARVANMLFIETPVGVGFSFSKTLADYSSSDASTAVDNYQAMQVFLTKFPQYTNQDFYLAGESYAGHYIPTVVDLICK
jgi:serine carboxypeptidase-like clade 2